MDKVEKCTKIQILENWIKVDLNMLMIEFKFFVFLDNLLFNNCLKIHFGLGWPRLFIKVAALQCT